MSHIIECKNVSKHYQQGGEKVAVLNDIDFCLGQQETVAIIGSSGAGKSTLLNLLGGLDTASKGQVLVAGQDLAQLSNKDLSQLRNQKLGFVYQFHHLLQEFNAIENVAMPLLIRGIKKSEAFSEADELLKLVGLSARAQHRPQALSGGERQRVAIARALVAKPNCVLMDEPTGNLDEHTSQSIQELIASLNETLMQSFIVVTHDKQVARQMDKQYQLSSGSLGLLEHV